MSKERFASQEALIKFDPEHVLPWPPFTGVYNRFDTEEAWQKELWRETLTKNGFFSVDGVLNYVSKFQPEKKLDAKRLEEIKVAHFNHLDPEMNKQLQPMLIAYFEPQRSILNWEHESTGSAARRKPQSKSHSKTGPRTRSQSRQVETKEEEKQVKNVQLDPKVVSRMTLKELEIWSKQIDAYLLTFKRFQGCKVYDLMGAYLTKVESLQTLRDWKPVMINIEGIPDVKYRAKLFFAKFPWMYVNGFEALCPPMIEIEEREQMKRGFTFNLDAINKMTALQKTTWVQKLSDAMKINEQWQHCNEERKLALYKSKTKKLKDKTSPFYAPLANLKLLQLDGVITEDVRANLFCLMTSKLFPEIVCTQEDEFEIELSEREEKEEEEEEESEEEVQEEKKEEKEEEEEEEENKEEEEEEAEGKEAGSHQPFTQNIDTINIMNRRQKEIWISQLQEDIKSYTSKSEEEIERYFLAEQKNAASIYTTELKEASQLHLGTGIEAMFFILLARPFFTKNVDIINHMTKKQKNIWVQLLRQQIDSFAHQFTPRCTPSKMETYYFDQQMYPNDLYRPFLTRANNLKLGEPITTRIQAMFFFVLAKEIIPRHDTCAGAVSCTFTLPAHQLL